MTRRLRAWWALPAQEKLIFLCVLLSLPMVSLMLQLLGYLRARRWLEILSSSAAFRHADAADVKMAERLAQLIAIAGRHGLVSATCLRQSLLLHTLLRRSGLPSRLQLGVRKEGGRFDAHAWVELGGQPLGQGKLLHLVLPAHSKVAGSSR